METRLMDRDSHVNAVLTERRRVATANERTELEREFDAIGGASLIKFGGFLKTGGKIFSALLHQPNEERRKRRAGAGPMDGLAFARCG